MRAASWKWACYVYFLVQDLISFCTIGPAPTGACEEEARRLASGESWAGQLLPEI